MASWTAWLAMGRISTTSSAGTWGWGGPAGDASAGRRSARASAVGGVLVRGGMACVLLNGCGVGCAHSSALPCQFVQKGPCRVVRLIAGAPGRLGPFLDQVGQR